MWLERWISPLWILFFLITTGYTLGKLKIKEISLGLSAVLVLSVVTGIFFNFFPVFSVGDRIIIQIDKSFLDIMQFLSTFGTALFIAIIGLASGYQITAQRQRKTFRYFLVGTIAVVLNLVLMKLILLIDENISEGLLYGVFCGAMTSTPGLATICESSPDFAAQASAGYSCSYLTGVIGVVFFVQLFSRNQKDKKSLGERDKIPLHYSSFFSDIIQISCIIVLGTMLGAIPLFNTKIFLGNTGGILVTGFLVGVFIRRKKPCLQISENNIHLFRTLGLLLFFVGTGIPAGINLIAEFQPFVFIYGIALTIFPICFTYCLSRCILKENKKTALNVVCGVMTSTPAFGVLSDRQKLFAEETTYTISYTGALLTMVLCLNILS